MTEIVYTTEEQVTVTKTKQTFFVCCNYCNKEEEKYLYQDCTRPLDWLSVISERERVNGFEGLDFCSEQCLYMHYVEKEQRGQLDAGPEVSQYSNSNVATT